jgi:RNA polymerase-binding transcription factor DksA
MPQPEGGEDEAAVLASLIGVEQARLIDEIGDLSDELAAIAESAAADAPDDEHDAEGSTIGYERARVQAILEHAKRRLGELDAVARLEPGVARRCSSCGDAIPGERLAALPATRICIACAKRSG